MNLYIKPFKAAVVAVTISVMASACVSVVSGVGKDIINKEMEAMGINGLAVSAYNSKGENITNTKLLELTENMEDTLSVSPVIIENTTATFPNGKECSAMLWGINSQAKDIVSLEIIKGRMFNNTEINSKARVCLVDESIALKMYKRSDICGKKLYIDAGEFYIDFTVIGTVKKGSVILNNLTGSIVPDFVYIPYSTMQNLSASDRFNQIIFTSTVTEITADDFKSDLSKKSSYFNSSVISLTNLAQQKEQINKITDTSFLSLFIVSCVSVLVCSISVASSVNTAVISLQKDIGIKISLGASKINIISEFLLSSLLACISGISVGIIIMILIIRAIEIHFTVPLYADVLLITASISATIILTTIFSFLPSYRAASMPPIKALNRE